MKTTPYSDVLSIPIETLHQALMQKLYHTFGDTPKYHPIQAVMSAHEGKMQAIKMIREAHPESELDIDEYLFPYSDPTEGTCEGPGVWCASKAQLHRILTNRFGEIYQARELGPFTDKVEALIAFHNS